MAGAAAAVSPPVEKADATAWIAVAAGALGAWQPVSGVSFAVGGCGFGAVLSNDPLFSPPPASS